MASAGLARNSHYVPQAMLWRWSDDDIHLYTYRIMVSAPSVPAWRRRPIRGLARQRDLYTVFGGGEELDDFERWLSSNYEQPGLEAIDKLVRRARLTPGRGECREQGRRGRREPGGRAESAPTARRLGRGPWRPGSGGARAGNGTWFCGCCAASRWRRSRVKSG